MLKVKLKYFSHTMPRSDSLEKSLMLGKIEGRRSLEVRSGVVLSLPIGLFIGIYLR